MPVNFQNQDKKPLMIELHAHSTASDGHLTPSELVQTCSDQGLEMAALTDHDTVAGLAEAREKARELGILFLPGIEIEINFRPGEFHLLGLGLQNWESMSPVLAQVLEKRKDRNLRIFAKMQEAGIPGTWEEIQAQAEGGTLGRPHFARHLIKVGKAKSVVAAFEKYLGADRPFYVPKEGLDLPEALDLIHKAGGKAVVAHPSSLYLSPPKVGELLEKWKEMGLDGVEAYHPGFTSNKGRRWEALAQERGLAVTAGSDFHGDKRPGRKLGRTSDGKPIEERFILGLFPDWRDRFR